jgi:hypothetical protein
MQLCAPFNIKHMAYKRKARIVFFCGSHPAPVSLATHYANTLGSDWMEARAAVLSGVAGEVPVLDDAALAWADLLAAAARRTATSPLSVRADPRCGRQSGLA